MINGFIPHAWGLGLDSEDVEEKVKTVAEQWFGSSTGDQLKKFISMTSDDSIFKSVWNYTGTIYDALSVLGVGLMMLFLTIKLLGEMTRTGQCPTQEFFIKLFANLAVGYIVITKGFDLLTKGILPFFDYIYDDIMAAITTSTTPSGEPASVENQKLLVGMIIGDAHMEGHDTWQSAWDDMPWIQQLIGFGSLWMYQGIAMLNVVLDFVPAIFLISRGLTICAYTMVAPIALADVSTGFEAMSTPSARFMKKYAALALQGSIVIITILAGRLIEASVMASRGGADILAVFSDSVAAMIYTIFVKLAVISVCQKGLQLSTDIIGN